MPHFHDIFCFQFEKNFCEKIIEHIQDEISRLNKEENERSPVIGEGDMARHTWNVRCGNIYRNDGEFCNVSIFESAIKKVFSDVIFVMNY